MCLKCFHVTEHLRIRESNCQTWPNARGGRSVLKRILFRTNIRRNSSAEYSAETDVAKLAHNSVISEYSVFGRIFGNLAEYSVFCRIFSQNCLIICQKCQVFYKKSCLFPLIAKIFGQLSQIFGKMLNIWPKYRIFGQKPKIRPNTECFPNVRIRPKQKFLFRLNTDRNFQICHNGDYLATCY